MRFKYQYVFESVGPIIIGVIVGESDTKSKQILKLNETSYDVAKHLVAEHEETELIDLFLDEYEMDRGQAQQIVETVVKYLQKLGVLTE